MPISSSHIASQKPLEPQLHPLNKLLQPPLHKEKQNQTKLQTGYYQ
jgi:hypothetical protein